MEFDFLPKLPTSNLDDRSFDDLVDECTLRIPRYGPEWTDHNLSDPGITMIELFAWLTDQTLMRFNQVPRKNYVAFLELLGIRLQPPKPAQTELTFYLSTSLSDLVALLQRMEGVRYIGPIVMFALHRRGDDWERSSTPEPFIDPGTLGLICSWADSDLRSSHVVSFLSSSGG